MVHMGCAYLTKKQMPRTFWFYAIVHLAWMMNAIPGTYSGHLALPFLPVHSVGHSECTWIPLFSLCCFHHKKDSNHQRSKHQAHTMDGVVIGRSPTLNALMVYNPRNQQYYEPDSYCIDSYRLPTLVYQDIEYDGSLFCCLLRDENPHMEEKYPPAHDLNKLTRPPICFCRGQSWTSLSLERLQTALLATFPNWFSSTMVPLRPFLFRIWHC
jgi:hypothetical protein